MPKKSVTVMLPTAPPEPMLEQAIRQRAYELYIKRGMALGHALDDWLQAEAELVHGHSTSDSNESERRHEQFRESPDQRRIEPTHRSTDGVLSKERSNSL